MSIMPDFGVVRSFQVFKPWAKVLGFCAVFALTAVFALPLISSQGMNSYIVVLVFVSVIVAILLVNPIQTVLQPLSADTTKHIEKPETGNAQTASSVSPLPDVSNEEIETGTRKCSAQTDT